MELPAEPILSKSVDHWELPADGTVAAEPKWDGYRTLAGELDDGEPVIRSRNGTDLVPGLPELAAALEDQLPAGSLLDAVMSPAALSQPSSVSGPQPPRLSGPRAVRGWGA